MVMDTFPLRQDAHDEGAAEEGVGNHLPDSILNGPAEAQIVTIEGKQPPDRPGHQGLNKSTGEFHLQNKHHRSQQRKIIRGRKGQPRPPPKAE